ncbi:MAG: 50S ribosomal protein L23 [Candidatus Micrarchaeia archaeon]
MTTLIYPLATEKAIGGIEKSNTITYIVALNATKKSVKEDFEKAFEVKVEKVRIANMPDNKKKAYITLKEGFKASDIAVKLKLV